MLMEKVTLSRNLTDYAREHVDECCLIFDWESVSGRKDDGGFYGQCYLSKDISVDNRIEHDYNPDFENNQTVEEMAKAAADYKAMYMMCHRLYRISSCADNFLQKRSEYKSSLYGCAYQ